MEEIDNEQEREDFSHDEEQLFLSEVVQGDHQLLYLDTYLREMYKV